MISSDISLEDLERLIISLQEQLDFWKDICAKKRKAFLKEVKKFYAANGYQQLGYRERRVLQFPLSDSYSIEALGGGIYRISSPGGSFEFAWDCPFLKRGTVVG